MEEPKDTQTIQISKIPIGLVHRVDGQLVRGGEELSSRSEWIIEAVEQRLEREEEELLD